MSTIASSAPRPVWLLSAYHAGSHCAWAVGYQRYSRQRIELLTMPGRFWKWRMQGGAVELASQARRRLETEAAPGLILATDMVNLPAWLGLMRRDLPPATPVVLYMHENQLTYPRRPSEKPDLTYAMINWLSQLSADCVLFNSRFHLEEWFEEVPRLLKHFPDYNHLGLIETVRAKSQVLPVGVELQRIAGAPPAADDHQSSAGEADVPLILWNQRWEYDKRPERFFALLYRLAAAGVRYRLAVAGENFRQIPAEFEDARNRLADRIVHWGYLAARAEYERLLRRADLVVSTADHEFFGISIVEAIAGGAFPLLPHRLSYPELIPAALHPACLYEDDEALYRLAAMRLAAPRSAPPSLRRHVLRTFEWRAVAPRYDDAFAALSAAADAR